MCPTPDADAAFECDIVTDGYITSMKEWLSVLQFSPIEALGKTMVNCQILVFVSMGFVIDPNQSPRSP
jgi:hypothetical protein